MYKYFTPGYELPNPLKVSEQNNLLNKLKTSVSKSLISKNPEKSFIETTYRTFEEFKNVGAHLKYCGFYEVDPNNSERTNPRSYNIGDEPGCREIPIYKGVIGATIRLFSKSIYITSVFALGKTDPNAHWKCDPNMKGSEIAINQTYIFKTGPKKGKRTSRMILDLDIEKENLFTDQGAGDLEKICLYAMNIIFPGPPKYVQIPGQHFLKELNSKNYSNV